MSKTGEVSAMGNIINKIYAWYLRRALNKTLDAANLDEELTANGYMSR